MQSDNDDDDDDDKPKVAHYWSTVRQPIKRTAGTMQPMKEDNANSWICIVYSKYKTLIRCWHETDD